MDMLTDLLSTVAEDAEVLLEEENYLLARVKIDGKSMIAEISSGSAGGITPGDWPDIEGILLPDSLIHPDNDTETRILLFSIPDAAELYIEALLRDDYFSEVQALQAGKKVFDILRRIHDEGQRIGYLGPENVLRTYAGKHYILGGARGIPDTPFSPPEAVGRTADDPRSDVYALGLLMFRLIAGSDNRETQIEAWNRLSDITLDLLENMVSPEADNRFPNLTVLSEQMKRIKPERKTEGKDVPCRRESSGSGGRKIPLYVPVVLLIALIITLLCVIKPDQSNEIERSEPDSTANVHLTDSSEVEPEYLQVDTLSIQNNTLEEPVVWISNCTGEPGRASEFRQEFTAQYSSVYACTGSLRSNSILLARREDPRIPLESQERIFTLAGSLAADDSTVSIKPVDMTLLLGRDLIEGNTQAGRIFPASDPAGTLYVDIANNRVEGTFGGTGAATWSRSILNNRSIIIDEEEWLMIVVDFRDGDNHNDELGIPSSLNSTIFLYRSELPLLNSLEEEIRKLILDGTAADSAVNIPNPPDIWILLGR